MYSMKDGVKILTLLICCMLACTSFADGGYLRSSAPLDDARGYCLDVAGFGVNARPDEPLRMHTCKYGEDNADQLFRWVDFATGHVEMPAYNRCLAAESAERGATLSAAQCEDSDLQAWTFVPNGNLVLRAYPELCLTIGEESFDAGAEILVTPGYKYRSSTMEPCRDRGDELQDIRWGRDDEETLSLANELRSGMPMAIQQGIRDFYLNGEGSGLAHTNALYENELLVYRSTEVKTTMNLAYGEHERHKLDVHVDVRRRGNDLAPVLVYLHGGAYVRGAKENSHNVGEFFASIGLVGVSATYRLAPEIRWPEGGNDIGAMVRWLSENIAEYGGDPEKIYLIGKSAGAGHAATYAFRPELFEETYPLVAGVIFVSGSFGANTEAYFGTDNLGYKELLGNISRGNVPTLITSAEYDSEGTAEAALRLAHELQVEHGNAVRLRQLPGHNHYSTNISIGTSDQMLSEEILDFVLSDSN